MARIGAHRVAPKATSSYHVRVLPSPPSPFAKGAANAAAANGVDGLHGPADARTEAFGAFRTGELVEVFTDSVRALARVREASEAGRLHIAFEMGEYLPWVDTAVLIRLAASGASGASGACGARIGARGCAARILHAGSSTALLQILAAVEELAPGREPFDTLPLLAE
jgi:hypothetical protein